MQTENIRMYLAFNYSDEQLAALLAHAESGKLSYNSCCCVVGIATAPHPLRGLEMPLGAGHEHLIEARKLPFAREAEVEFLHLGAKRREIVAGLAREEMERRGKLCDEFLESIHEESAIG